MKQLLAISFVTIVAITISACGGSSTGPDTESNDNNTNEPVTYTVSVDMTPSDGGTVSPSLDENYEEGKEIQLLANAADKYVFSGWTGDMEGSVNPLPLTVSQDFNITANFELKNYDLSITTEGQGSVQENVLEQKSKEYEHGTAVELVATPATGFKFVEWKGDVTGTDNPTQITVDDPKAVTAVFEKKSYTLTVQTQGSGAVSEQVVSKAKDYEYGDVVELSPNPAEGWKFVEWDGDLTGTDNPAQITVDTTKKVTALFERKTFALKLNTAGEGSVTKDPDQPEYKYGSSVTLTAEPADSWGFKEWSGEISGTYPTMEITVYSEKDIMAVFEEKSYELTISTKGEGLVTEETVQTKSYNHGASVKLTADPEEGWRFVDWEGDLTGSSNPEQLIVDNSKEVTAVFEPLFYLAKNGVTVVCPDAEPGQKGILNGEQYGKEYVAVDSTMLYQKVENTADVTSVCTTHITNMSELLKRKNNFNQDINTWDVSSVTAMSEMFLNADSFNQDLESWDVSSVTDMKRMFYSANSFNGNINSWSVGSVTNMSRMFYGASNFNTHLNSWDVSSVTDMGRMFSFADSFNGEISGWNVSSVTDMSRMFNSADNFNGDLRSWDVSSVTDMSRMFGYAASFNAGFVGDLSSWDVSSVTDMSRMFYSAESFNRDISSWDVSSVTDMSSMFYNATSFNLGYGTTDLNSWDVSSVTDMSYMFRGAESFNRDVSSWDVSSVTDMGYMFRGADNFNGDISTWNVSNVTAMYSMFYNASSFNQNISGWCVSDIDSKPIYFDFNAGFDGDPSLQPQWGTCP